MIPFIFEAALVGLIVLVTLTVAGPSALSNALEQSADLGTLINDGHLREIVATARSSKEMWATGIGLLFLGRSLNFRASRESITSSLLIPGVATCTAIGLVLQLGYGDPIHHRHLYSDGFGGGVMLAGAATSVLFLFQWILLKLRLPGDLKTESAQWVFTIGLGIVIAIGLGALWQFGRGPTLNHPQKINLFLPGVGAVQPIEALKLALVCMLALALGPRAEQLRTQREGPRILGMPSLAFPRWRYFLPAVGATFAAVLVLVFALKDLGAMMVLFVACLALYAVVTQSRTEPLLLAVLGGAAYAFIRGGMASGDFAHINTRFDMCAEPWQNGLPFGSQLAQSLWAHAAGGVFGQGFGHGAFGAIANGHNDLALASLAEAGGLFWSLVYLTMLMAIVLQGLWIAYNLRTPTRQLLALGISMLLLAQWLVVFGGSSGVIPLTGIVVPFLSHGRTSMLVFFSTFWQGRVNRSVEQPPRYVASVRASA